MIHRISVLLGVLAAAMVAACGGISGLAPGLIVWRAALAFVAVWTFQRSVLSGLKVLCEERVAE